MSATQTTVPAAEGKANAGTVTHSSDAAAVGALASEGPTPAAESPEAATSEHEGPGRSLDAPRPQVSQTSPVTPEGVSRMREDTTWP